MRRAAVSIILTLAACHAEDTERAAREVAEAQTSDGAGKTPAPASSASSQPSMPLLELDREGLRLVLGKNATDILAFGMSRVRVEAIVGRVLQRSPERTTIEECGAGPMEFTAYGPLQLNFQDDKFAGWFLDGSGGPSTGDGVAIGSTRAEAGSGGELTIIPDSTLGEEFVLGKLTDESIGGFFDGAGSEAKISQLFAGINCFFR